MNTTSQSDQDLLQELRALPGWGELFTDAPVPLVPAQAVDEAATAVRAAAEAHDINDSRSRGSLLAAGPLESIGSAVVVRAPSAAEPGVRASRVATKVKRRRILIASAMVAAVTAIAVVAPSFLRAPSASAEAASLLTHAADTIHSNDPAATPAQWWRVTTSGVVMLTATSGTGPQGAWLVRATNVRYLAVDGSRPTITVAGAETVDRQISGPPGLLPAASDLLASDTVSSSPAPKLQPGAWQTGNPTFLAELPRDTTALRARLYATVGSDSEAFTYVADALRSGLVPADLRAALYRVLATIPGVEITSAKASIDGLAGVGFGRLDDPHGLRPEIVIDPTDGAFVGERTVVEHQNYDLSAGTVIEQTTVSRALVSTVPADVIARLPH